MLSCRCKVCVNLYIPEYCGVRRIFCRMVTNFVAEYFEKP